MWASVAVAYGLSSCSFQALNRGPIVVTHGLSCLLCSIFPDAGKKNLWGFPRSGIKPMSPGSTGRFFTTEPPGKPHAISLDDLFFLQSCPVCWWVHQKHSSFLLQCFWFLTFPFDFYFSSLFTLPIYAYILPPFFIRVLNTLILFILNSKSDNFKISAISEPGSDVWFVSSNWFFFFAFPAQ